MNDGSVERLVLLAGDGKVGERFNLVLVAEGYRQQDEARFRSDADHVLAELQAVEPFKRLLPALNIFRLDVWSTEAGADRGNTQVATYFDAAFAAHPPRMLLVDATLVADTVSEALTERGAACSAHKVLVVVNTPHDGGSGGPVSGIAVSARAHAVRTAIHELGHTFGLVDEYGTDGSELHTPNHGPNAPAPAPTSPSPNLSITFRLDQLPWKDLVVAGTPLPTEATPSGPPITVDTVGAFATDADYRPQWFCRMRYSGTVSYCQVCTRHIACQLEGFLP